MECFKRADPSDTGEPRTPRVEMECPGCGEPIFVSPDLRYSLKFCSLRCYQRDHRKSKRRRYAACTVCKEPLPDGKRADARFCSSACRQWQYRRRQASPKKRRMMANLEAAIAAHRGTP